jgi:hypothetical protein
MTADYNTSRNLLKTHHVCKLPAMNTEACCPKADHPASASLGNLAPFTALIISQTLFNLLNTDVTKNTLTADTPQL